MKAKKTNLSKFTYSRCGAFLLALVLLLGAHTAVAASAGESPFRDIAEDDWFYSDVVYAYECELMNGIAANEFAPNAPLSRAMCATVLYRMAGKPDTAGLSLPFSDVADGEWYTEAVKWAYAGNIVKGHGNGTFAPQDNITRAQLATMLLRFANYGLFEIPGDKEWTAFLDSDSVPQYAKGAVYMLYRAGIINGKPGNVFAPNADTTRAEVAAMIRRFAENTLYSNLELLDKYGLSLSAHACVWIDKMPSLTLDIAPNSDVIQYSDDTLNGNGHFSVALLKSDSTPEQLPRISVHANINGGYNYDLEMLGNSEECMTFGNPYVTRTFIPGSLLIVEITLTIGDETGAFYYYLTVDEEIKYTY